MVKLGEMFPFTEEGRIRFVKRERSKPLDKLKVGMVGELRAQLILMQSGLDVYQKVIDVDGIDFVVRNKKSGWARTTFNEIQVKTSKKYLEGHYLFKIRDNKNFHPRLYHYFMFICGDKKEELYFIIPSKTLASRLEGWSGKRRHYINKNKKHGGWIINIFKREDNKYYLKYDNQKRKDYHWDMEDYKNNLAVLR